MASRLLIGAAAVLLGLQLVSAAPQPLTTTINTSTGTSTTTQASSTATGAVQSQGATVPCGAFNHPGNTFYLRAHVIFSNWPESFENLYVQMVPQNSPPSVPQLSFNRATAGVYYFDASTSSLAQRHTGCVFSGLSLFPTSTNGPWGSVLLTDSVGSAVMTLQNSEVLWVNDRFGSWLVCWDAVKSIFELYWWDVSSGLGIDADKCAKVQLIVENL